MTLKNKKILMLMLKIARDSFKIIYFLLSRPLIPSILKAASLKTTRLKPTILLRVFVINLAPPRPDLQYLLLEEFFKLI